MDVDGDEADSQEQVVKKLVRYALACEYQRMPIKRANITEKGWCYVVCMKAGLIRSSNGQAARSFQTCIRTCANATQKCIWYADGRTAWPREGHFEG